jgi:hypothetical protein
VLGELARETLAVPVRRGRELATDVEPFVEGQEDLEALLVERVVGGEVESGIRRGIELEPPHPGVAVDDGPARPRVSGTQRLEYPDRPGEHQPVAAHRGRRTQP